METSFRVDPSDRSAPPQPRPISALSPDLAAVEVAAEGALEEDGSFEWFVNLLLAENASKR